MEVTMDAIVERCAGLDVHLDTVVACVLYGKLDIKPKKEVKTFSTTTKGLLDKRVTPKFCVKSRQL